MEELHDLGAVGAKEIQQILRQRASEYHEQSVQKALVPEMEEAGWEVARTLKFKAHLRKLKLHYEYFEDRVWCVLARMGFDWLNRDRTFRVEYAEGANGKQFDVFAADDECVIVVECKSAKARKAGNFPTEINEIGWIREGVIRTLRALFGGKKMRVAWLFWTQNIGIGDNDQARLKHANIVHLTEDDLRYYEQLAEHLGPSAKYQFLGQLFRGGTIPNLPNRVPAVRGKMGGHTYYSFCVEPATLLKICYVLHRTIPSDEDLHCYQRMIKKTRVREIRDFIDGGGMFPNSVVINVETESRRSRFQTTGNKDDSDNATLGVLHLPQEYHSAFVIDGQHRLYGYAGSKYKDTNSIPVVAFENLDSEKQAQLFIDINHKQKSVPRNLLMTLMADLKWGSDNHDEAIAALKSRLVQWLSERAASPLAGRIVIAEGKKTDQACLTLNFLMSYGLNRTRLFGEFSRREIKKTGPLWGGSYDATLQKSFQFFVTIFDFIAQQLPNQWARGRAEGGFAAMNIGVASLIGLSSDIVEHLAGRESLDASNLSGAELGERVIEYMGPVVEYLRVLSPEELKQLRNLFGGGGPERVRREFQRAVHERHLTFEPEGLEEWLRDEHGEFTLKAREPLRALRSMIVAEVASILGDNHGESAWFQMLVPREVQRKCADRRLDDPRRLTEEHYLRLDDYHLIVKDNWTHFSDVFADPTVSSRSKEHLTAYYAVLSSVERKLSTPDADKVTESEFLQIEACHKWLVGGSSGMASDSGGNGGTANDVEKAEPSLRQNSAAVREPAKRLL